MGNLGNVPGVPEKDEEAFVANFLLAINELWRYKEGEEVRRTEWQQIVHFFVKLN